MISNPTLWKTLQAQRMLQRMQAMQARDYRNPENLQRLQAQSQNMDPAQKYLFAVANHMPPTALGLTPGQIYAAEQGLTGYHMDPQTGQITKANAMGGRDAVDPNSLLSTINTNLGGSFGMENGNMVNDAAWINGGSGSYNIQPGQSGYGMGKMTNPSNPTGNTSNIGGGAGNPNNAAGGLYGAAGNALRQMFMDSQQFNPNGANTYAIQNMNLSGLGDLGSNMGGMPSNGLFGGAVPAGTPQTAQGTGSTSGNVMQNPTQLPPTPISGGGGNHTVRQGGATGGLSGMGLGTNSGAQLSTAQQYQPPTTTTTTTPQVGGTQPSGGGLRTPSYFGGAMAHPLGPRIQRV